MKPQVLVYGNRKQDDMQFPFSTLAEKEAAFLKLFKYLKDTWKVYDSNSMSSAQRIQYAGALLNIGKNAINLLTMRKTYEYEVWHVEKVPAKGAERISKPVAVKQSWQDVKGVRTRSQGYIASVTLTLPNNKEIEYLLVPHQTTAKDWDDMNAATHFITDALSTEWKGEMHAQEGLTKALNMVNELRNTLQMARYPGTASPTCTPDKVFERVMNQAEGLLKEYSNSPIEELVTIKRRPTELSEAQEELAKAKRTISALTHHLKKAGAVGWVMEIGE